VIFASTGGVTEDVLRKFANDIPTTLAKISYTGVRA
jgi:hypothetical protein